MVKAITRLYRQCDPAKPLPAGDSRYVSCEGVRGQGDLVVRIANAIRRSEMPQHVLFSGHRGGGKSTELLRLTDALENPSEGEERFFVVYFEADAEDIDVNDTDFPDVLLAIIRHVGKVLRERLKMDLRPSLLLQFLKDVWNLLRSEVALEKIELDVGIGRVTTAIRNSPDVRAQLRKALEPHVSNLIEAANEILNEARVKLKQKGYYDIVIIVDNLDRIVLRSLEGGFNTHERLFINRGAHLNSLHCHIVYTLPISMVFSPKATALTAIFGRRSDVLPMVKVIQRDGTAHPEGINVMRNIVRKRLNVAEVAEEKAFDSEDTLDYLCRMSGGHVRNLLIFIRSASDWLDELPVMKQAAEQAVREMCNEFERALNRPEFFDVLRQVDKTHDLPGSEHDQLLLYNFSLLEYLNDTPRYGVNPAVRELEKFKLPKRAKPRR